MLPADPGLRGLQPGARRRRPPGDVAARHHRPGVELDQEPERAGLPADDPRWRVPWLEPFLEVPADAVWPRLMTVPHQRAAGSLGPEFIAWAEERSGRELRWWQRLAGYQAA